MIGSFFLNILKERSLVFKQPDVDIIAEASVHLAFGKIATTTREKFRVDRVALYRKCAITEMSSANIYWVLNYGTDLEKFFDPKEIEWLKDIVNKANDRSQKQSSAGEGQNRDSRG